MALRTAFQSKSITPSARIVRTYGFEGVTFQPPPEYGPDWLRHPFESQEQSGMVAFLAQIEEENFAHLMDDHRLRLSWDALYELAASEDHRDGLPLIGMPPLRPWRPRLESHAGLADTDFAILLAGWIAPNGEHIQGDLRLAGAMMTWKGEQSLLTREAWRTVEAIAIFHRRWLSQRTGDGNRRGWATIRKHALAANADLSDFLKSTVVLTPDKLKLRLRKGGAGTRLVEVIPHFAGAPEQWLDTFDRGEQVLDRYDIPNGEGLLQVMLSPEVKSVLREIKAFPGRRVAGARAEAFVRNPFAVLGPEAGAVLDPAEFEAERERAALGLARFTPELLRDPQGLLRGVLLHIEESLASPAPKTRLEIATVAELERLVAQLAECLEQEAQSLVWNGQELEVLGETREHLVSLQKTLAEWRQQELFLVAELLDLSHYSERIEGFGVDQPRYSPFLARKSGAWFPEQVSYGVSWQPSEESPPVAMNIDDPGMEDWKRKIEAARQANQETIALPGMPSPIPIPEAERLLCLLNTARHDVAQGQLAAESLKPLPPACIRKRLVLRSNVETVDYEERRGVLSLAIASQAELPKSLKPTAQLKHHQQEGLRWLQHLYAHSPADCRGALLADEMGLGKTLQVLALIAGCLEADAHADPFLIVAPVALLENWKQEIDKFFLPGALPLLPLYGGALLARRLPRETAEAELAQGVLGKLLVRDWLGDARIVLTTYETLRDLEFSLARQKWSVIVCDEAQKIKNPNALVTRAAKKQNARFKIACTGTPVENSLADLWCLFDFIQPGLLGSLSSFGATYSRPIEANTEDEAAPLPSLRRNALRTLIEPQTLRRTKADVVGALPAKIVVEGCRRLPLSAQQRTLYAEALRRYRDPQAQKAASDALSLLLYLRALCTHPKPLNGHEAHSLGLLDLEKSSPKMAWLLAELSKVRARQEKVIIFCEIRELQRALQRAVSERFRVVPDIINGQTSTAAGQPGNRHRRVMEFQEKPGFAVMILSPLAAGFGLNIQGANHVVHFTRSWNPAKEDQATDRAHRIGQTRDVFVYCPLVTAPDFQTFDARLDQLLEQKRALSRDMLNAASDISPQEFGGF